MENKLFKEIENIKILDLFEDLNNVVKKIDTVYHYTSIPSFYNLLKSGEIWCSTILEMNDPLEIKFGREIIKEKILKNNPDKNKIVQWIDDMYIIENDLQNNLFILSTSEEQDSYQQWINYADNGEGVSLGFKRKELFDFLTDNLSDEEFIYTYPIQYYNNDGNVVNGIGSEFERKVDTLITEIYKKSIQQNNIELMKELNLLVILLSTLIKDEFHKEEKEIRYLIFTKKELDRNNIVLKNDKLKNVYKSTFYKIPTAMKSYDEDTIRKKSFSFLESVMFGPRNQRDNRLKRNLKMLVNDFNQKVTNDEIQFSRGQLK